MLKKLIESFKDGTIAEVKSELSWVMAQTRKYVWVIILYTVLGIIGSAFGLLSTVLSKNIIDIVTKFRNGELIFIANQGSFTHNGKEIEAPKALIFGSGLNLPLRAVAEELGFEVIYNHETKTVDINEK